MIRRISSCAALAGVVLAIAVPAGAPAQDEDTIGSQPGSAPTPQIGGSLPEKPKGFLTSPREAIKLADTDPKVIAVSAERGRLESFAEAKPPTTWQIGYYDGDQEVVQVLIDDPTKTIRESWTGNQVAWQMARGYNGQFGHLLNAPYVWIPLALLFFFGLFDFRRWRRMVHLDLLVLLSFGASQYFFDKGDIGVSVPLAYPPLVYLLCRMLWIGFKGQRGGLNPSTPLTWLAIATMFLIGFRVALNIADSGTIDVGYAGVIGADKLTHGDPVYQADDHVFAHDNPFGDTYGPVTYYAYVPFELAMPWSGEWDELPASHGASIFFDLATIAGLFLMGRRLRRAPPDAPEEEQREARLEGNGLGVILAFAWCAYPYTTYALQSNSNDSLVAALIVWAFVAFASPAGRGVLLGLASMAKFAPLVLAPLFAVGERGLVDRFRRDGEGFGLKSIVIFSVAFVGTMALVLVPTIIDPGLSEFYDRTIENQINRESPFSIWGQEPSLDWLQAVVRFGTLVLAVAVAFVPRRRTLTQLTALAAGVMIASQLGIDHWFYLYLPWFFGLALVALAPNDRSAPGS